MDIGDILRTARATRRLSQLDLALTLGVSQRHVSFVESGRARPSRDLILAWTDVVAATESVRNAALLKAGFAVTPPVVRGGKPAGRPVPDVHIRVLEAHDPWPGLIFDPDWRMQRLNVGARRLFSWIMPEFLQSLHGDEMGWDMIAGIAHDGGLLSRMAEPWIIGARLLAQLRIEQLMRPSLTARVDELGCALQARFGAAMIVQDGQTLRPGLNLDFVTSHGRLRFFTVQSVFKLPQDVAPETVRTGLWYPNDVETQDILRWHAARDAG